MKTETTNHQPPPRFLRFVVEKILPRALRGDYAGALNERYKSVWKFVPDSAATVANGYRIQAIGAFNKTAFVAEIGAVVFCFAAASLSLPLLIVLGAVLAALTLRDAYRHPHRGSAVKPAADAAPVSQYYLDSAGDAATAAVFLLLSQALMLQVSPPLAVPGTVLFRGALVCLPLLSILRMVLRARPQKPMPFEGSKMSARAIYKMTWRLNILWTTACLGTILTNPRVIPAFIPGHDFLVGFIPTVTFGMWIRLQYDVLSNDDRTETVLSDWEKKEMERQREAMIKSVDKRHRLYLVYAGLEALFFLWLAMPSAIDVWPWLSGGKADVDFLRLGSDVVAFATVVLSWNYVKNSNRAAARAIQEKIDARTKPMSA